MFRSLLLIALLALVGFTACSDDDAEDDGGGEVTVESQGEARLLGTAVEQVQLYVRKANDDDADACSDTSLGCNFAAIITVPASEVVEGATLQFDSEVTAEADALTCNNYFSTLVASGSITFTEVADTHITFDWSFEAYEDPSGGQDSSVVQEPRSGTNTVRLCDPLP